MHKKNEQMNLHASAGKNLEKMISILNNPDRISDLKLTIHTADDSIGASYDLIDADCLELLRNCLKDMRDIHTCEYIEWLNTSE